MIFVMKLSRYFLLSLFLYCWIRDGDNKEMLVFYLQETLPGIW